MSYKNYRFDSSGCAEVRPYIYLRQPEKLTTPEDITYYDNRTAQTIKELEAIIANLKEYRQDLAARYGQLETMSYTRLLKLERRPHWQGNIEYHITITRTMEDGSQTQELREVYPGKERRKAFARAQELRKQFPGIPYEQDTEKRKWER